MGRSYAQLEDFVGRLTPQETADMIVVCLDNLVLDRQLAVVIEYFKSHDNLDPLSVAVNDAQIEIAEKEKAAEGGTE